MVFDTVRVNKLYITDKEKKTKGPLWRMVEYEKEVRRKSPRRPSLVQEAAAAAAVKPQGGEAVIKQRKVRVNTLTRVDGALCCGDRLGAQVGVMAVSHQPQDRCLCQGADPGLLRRVPLHQPRLLVQGEERGCFCLQARPGRASSG